MHRPSQEGCVIVLVLSLKKCVDSAIPLFLSKGVLYLKMMAFVKADEMPMILDEFLPSLRLAYILNLVR